MGSILLWVSFDLYFWLAGAAKDPGRLADRLAEERAGGLRPDERVLAFRAELLRRWPGLADMIAPWHDDLGWRQPSGRTDLADRYVMIYLPWSWEPVDALPALAGLYGLDCYDPQCGKLIPSKPRPADTSVTGAAGAGSVAGQVGEDRVVALFQYISRCIGYRYDDLDEAALTGALDDADPESADSWFTYPLHGAPPLLVHLAQSTGSTTVNVRVEGAMDALLAARIEAMLDPL
jgi:hypothetical protein